MNEIDAISLSAIYLLNAVHKETGREAKPANYTTRTQGTITKTSWLKFGGWQCQRLLSSTDLVCH